MASNKGSMFERDISKYLSKWLTGSEKPYQYWRMPGSGALATISEENVGLSGDVRSLTREAEFLTRIFSLELKNGYPKTSFWQHFADIKNFGIRDFWSQCCGDAEKSNKRPMLIYRKKGRKPLVGIDIHTYMEVCVHLGSLSSISMRFKDLEYVTLELFDFYSFFDIITPDIIKETFKDGEG